MAKFFERNIDRTGRVVRALWGVAMLVLGIFALRFAWWAAAIFGALALFAFYEAARGWCVARACGIKTRY